MEIFLVTGAIIILIVLLCLNFFHFTRINIQLNHLNETQKRLAQVLTEQSSSNANDIEKILFCVNDTNRSLLALRDSLDQTKPIKPNNWDSFREAFKGPARIEVNERN